MSAPFGPKATATAEAGDLFMITRGSGAGLEVEKVDPVDAATTVLSGSGAPASGTGSDGDFYIRTSDWTIYGPKTAGAWGSATSLIGAAGSAGAAGAAGAAFLA